MRQTMIQCPLLPFHACNFVFEDCVTFTSSSWRLQDAARWPGRLQIGRRSGRSGLKSRSALENPSESFASLGSLGLLVDGKLTSRDDHPDGVHENEVEVEVEGLGPGVAQAIDDVLKVGSSVVQNVAVNLAKTDQTLQREPQRVTSKDHGRDKQASRSPGDRSDALHAQHKGVLREVAAVRERVLFPHLSNPCLVCANVKDIHDVVSFEEDVDAAGEDEPQQGEELGFGEVGLQALGDEVGAAEEDGAGAEEDGEDGGHAGLVGDVARDGGAQRVVVVGRVGEDLAGIARQVHCDVLHVLH
jgi:hypothetical protein